MMANTLRDIDYADDGAIRERLKQSREALALRTQHLSEWSYREIPHERAEIDYIAGWLKWLEFGGPEPYWIAIEESRLPGERMLQV